MQHAHIQVITEHCCGSCFHIANTNIRDTADLEQLKTDNARYIPKISAFENVHQIVLRHMNTR